MDSNLAEKIERLEAQLPRWEKWLYACFGAAVTMLGNSIARAFERSYLTDAFFRSLKNVNPAAFTENAPSITLTDPISLAIQQALFVPYWHILAYFLLVVMVMAAAWLAFHPAWRQAQPHMRLNLMFGYMLAGWIALLSLGFLETTKAGNGYNLLVVVWLLALSLAYWQFRRKKDKAEEVFP
ncbi:MAG: hypothetical protein OHK0041_08920 [Anaerolineales bacterium]